jgi:hypothetical protein
LQQDHAPLAQFQIEHIVARQHGGDDEPSNLALACHHCNLHKGPNLTGIDVQTGQIVPLFHPRQQTWDDHFSRQGTQILGISAVGRATVAVLAMNDRERVKLRSVLLARGLLPP